RLIGWPPSCSAQNWCAAVGPSKPATWLAPDIGKSPSMSANVIPASSSAPRIASSCNEKEVRSGNLPCFVLYTPTMAAWRLGKPLRPPLSLHGAHKPDVTPAIHYVTCVTRSIRVARWGSEVGGNQGLGGAAACGVGRGGTCPGVGRRA